VRTIGPPMPGQPSYIEQAVAAVAKGKWQKALEAYQTLEKTTRNDGTWSQKVGEMFRKLDRKVAAVDAFSRAADLYSKSGFLLKAVAVAKLALELDPTATAIQAKIAAYHAEREVRPAAGAMAARALPPARASAVAVAPALASPPPVAVALADLPLARMLPSARASTEFVAESGEAACEITFDVDRRSEVTARAVLPRTPLFSALSEPDLARLIAGVRREDLAQGETLFSQDDAGDALYVIASGEVAVLVRDPIAAEGGDAPKEIARLAEGSFFGEIALLTSAPRSATIQARAATELLVIDRQLVHTLIAESPEMLDVLLRFLRERLVSILTETSPLFAPLNASERAQVVSRFQFLQVAAGTRLVEQGKQSPGLYVMLAGHARVAQDGAEISRLGPRDVFGELSLLTEKPAVAGVETLERSFLLRLPRADFAELIMTHPQMLDYFYTLVDSRTGPVLTLGTL
jgi:CRP-like cAMP-binding protein